MPMHPLPALLNQGVPVALCSDDPAVFGNMGLTFDYFQVRSKSSLLSLPSELSHQRALTMLLS